MIEKLPDWAAWLFIWLFVIAPSLYLVAVLVVHTIEDVVDWWHS